MSRPLEGAEGQMLLARIFGGQLLGGTLDGGDMREKLPISAGQSYMSCAVSFYEGKHYVPNKQAYVIFITMRK